MGKKYQFLLCVCSLLCMWCLPLQGESVNSLDMTLFYRPSCPYCQKVIQFMDKHEIVIAMEDISDATQLSELIAIGGKRQVPCLVINGKALYESDAIIAWIGEHTKELGGV